MAILLMFLAVIGTNPYLGISASLHRAHVAPSVNWMHGKVACRSLILIALVAWSLPCSAGTPSPLLPQAKVAFKQYAPTSRFHDYATDFGDINGDGLTDFVTFVGDPNYNDNGVENLKVVVFLGAKDKTFNFYEVSSEILGHQRVYHALMIKKQSLYLSRGGSGGCCSRWAEEFQFKIRDGHLILIGLETANYHPEGITDPDTGVSANLLTGRVIKWVKRANASKGKKEKKRSVEPTLKPVPFKDFDHDSFSDKYRTVLW
jgi:hypothetical protein